MIRKVKISGFKRFESVEFTLPGHIVLAGPNNMGKTTMLQAVAAWNLAFERWRTLNDFHRHGTAFTRMPITRQQFSAVPLRSFDLLWRDRAYSGNIVIEIESDAGWSIPIEFMADSTEQVYVRPVRTAESEILRSVSLPTVFIPPMTGLGTEEPVYTRPKVDQLLGQAKPGDVIRNLLVEAARSDQSWTALSKSIRDLFGYELIPPDSAGANILAEYCQRRDGPRFDLASAGSGFQQVLMLLTFLYTCPASVLLLDEPDAHLHVILQDAIYGELRAVASAKSSQLLIATHSEVIINSVDPRELCLVLQTPRMLADTEERRRLVSSLGILTNTDIMLAEDAPGVLYLEGHTDLEILRAWADVLGHPARELLTTKLFWRPTVAETRSGAAGIPARDHYGALKLVREGLPALEILDGDARAEIEATPITGQGLQRARWPRYEIGSYLVHPNALERFIERQLGGSEASAEARKSMRSHMESVFRKEFLEKPLEPEPLVESYLRTTKARTDILPRILDAAGLPGLPYTRYHEIASLMTAEEIHSDVVQMLDSICRAFGRA